MTYKGSIDDTDLYLLSLPEIIFLKPRQPWPTVSAMITLMTKFVEI